jgi:uncharacterized membrane protein
MRDRAVLVVKTYGDLFLPHGNIYVGAITINDKDNNEHIDFKKDYTITLEERKQQLLEEINSKKKAQKREITFYVIGSIALISLVVFNLVFQEKSVQVQMKKEPNLYLGVATIFAMLAYIGSAVLRKFAATHPQTRGKLTDIENELDLIKMSDITDSQRAEKLFNNHHNELKRYYDENLTQSRVIFWIGVGSIIAGFIIVLITIFMVWQNLDNELANKLIIGGLGAVAAILTNFIGFMYLKMHAETTKSLTQFHNRFVNTHHFHFGNFLISKIEDDTKREEALANLALSINQTATLEEIDNQQQSAQ